MASLTFVWNAEGPLSSDGVTAEDATWGPLKITLTDGAPPTVLTRLLDHRAQAPRDHVYGAVLPLAEWLLDSWYGIFCAWPTEPSRQAGNDATWMWLGGHCLRFAGDGATLPDVTIAPYDEHRTELRWAARAGDRPLEFLCGNGRVWLDRHEVMGAARKFVDSVVRRIEAAGASDDRASALIRRHRAVFEVPDPVERLAASSEVPWWHWPTELLDAVRSQRDQISADADLAGALASALRPGVVDAELYRALGDSIATVRDALDAAPTASERWHELRAAVRKELQSGDRAAEPWRRGWEAAHAFRAATGVDAVRRADPKPWYTEIGLGDSGVELSEFNVDFATGWSAAHAPRVVGPTYTEGLSDVARRFHDWKRIFPALFRGTTDRSHTTVVHDRAPLSGAEARAFATEMVAPKDRIVHWLNGRTVIDDDDVVTIAREFGAPSATVRHQIENHDLAVLFY